MKVLLLSKYGRLGASSRMRFYQYLPHLERFDIQVTAAPLLDDLYVTDLYAGKGRSFSALLASYAERLRRLLTSRTYDLLWIEKELFPYFPALAETLLKAARIPYIVDYDDAVFHTYDQHRRGLVRLLLGGKIDAVMRNASLVVAGNDYLADRARRAGSRVVEIIPTVIDLESYPVGHQHENDRFTIGWIGTPPTSKYLQLLNQVVAGLGDLDSCRFLFIGIERANLAGARVEYRRWSEANEAAAIGEFDVGIMPLTDGPWEQGKCGYKLIQYMACGVPVVASPVGVNCRIVDDGKNGFLAGTADAWIRALSRLRNDRSLRQEMGARGRSKVAARYSLQVTAPRLAELILGFKHH